RSPRTRGHGLPGRRRPLAVVRAGDRRTKGPRGRPDRRRPRGEGARSRRRLRGEPRRRGAGRPARLARRVPRLRAAVRPCRRSGPAARAARARTLAPTPRPDPGRDRPAAVRPARRARRQRRHRAGGRALTALTDRRPPGDEADVRSRQDGRTLSGTRPMTEPHIDRAHIPDYGVPTSTDGTLPWAWATERLER